MNARAQVMDERQWRWADMTVLDLDEVLGIEQQVYTHPWTRGNFIDALAAQNLAWVLRHQLSGELLAYCVALQVLDECHLLNIAVAQGAWGRGLGQRTLERLIDHQRAAGAAQIWLEVRETNARAQALYARLGFVEVGQRRGYYPALQGQREDARVLRLDLQGAGA
ncbi:ribosomal-protein-alanine N-acetyltransferase [Inhella inkyongensis]|uniref:[Ribosomal protein bS18]-alanine N-acetyltransferase n=1 Tax=Inhella inkyongensis TaxID=392593 RepID=A0A840RYP8_9BURK|nr:ribosomal protein S18-alanine N-acetyltransferase [Inhella inkyongensis]MBB5203095.1 ribosomal-protein-alanine N-acetyltransferase [Inhella inkyongensis]